MATREAMIEAISKMAGLPRQESEKAFQTLVSIRGIVLNPSHGYEVTYGGYMDREVLRRAVAFDAKSDNA